MTHRTLAPILFSFATLTGCLDDTELDSELELDETLQEIGTPKYPRPACGTSCWWQGEMRGTIWDGHDSAPQIASDVGTGKVARDITYCLIKSAVGSNGQREIAANRVGAGTWYEQGVSTRLGLSAATSPASGAGSITGWHAVTLTAFGQKLNPDVQWFEIKFPTELKSRRPTGTYYYDDAGRLVPAYYNPTGYYTDARSDYFDGSKPIAGGSPAWSVTLDVAQPVNLGGTNLLGTSSVFGNNVPNLFDAQYPGWETGSMSMVLGQTLSSSKPSSRLNATIPIVKSGVLDIKLYATAEVRHYLQIVEGQNPDAPATRGEIVVDMGSKTSFKIRVRGKLDLGLFDVEIDETLFDWAPVNQTKRLGYAAFDNRRIYQHIDADGRTDANPAGWLSTCLASTPSVTSETPVSDPQQWVEGIKNTVLDKVMPCPDTHSELQVGRLCDTLGRILPTYPATPGQIGG